jgi:hypothetical protein
MYAAHQPPPSPSHSAEGNSLLDELDKIAPIKSFDAFPKVRTRRAELIF